MNNQDIQNALNKLGFPCKADGVVGPETTAQITRFQQAYCGPPVGYNTTGWLTIDGKAGPATEASLQWALSNNALVSYFSIQEIACKHCGCAYVKRELLSAMFKLRQAHGPVVVVDAYRCAEHNAAVGGAPNSEHVTGEAFDPQKGVFSEDQAHMVGFHGIGKNSAGQIDHLDVRPANADFADAGNG